MNKLNKLLSLNTEYDVDEIIGDTSIACKPLMISKFYDFAKWKFYDRVFDQQVTNFYLEHSNQNNSDYIIPNKIYKVSLKFNENDITSTTLLHMACHFKCVKLIRTILKNKDTNILLIDNCKYYASDYCINLYINLENLKCLYLHSKVYYTQSLTLSKSSKEFSTKLIKVGYDFKKEVLSIMNANSNVECTSSNVELLQYLVQNIYCKYLHHIPVEIFKSFEYLDVLTFIQKNTILHLLIKTKNLDCIIYIINIIESNLKDFTKLECNNLIFNDILDLYSHINLNLFEKCLNIYNLDYPNRSITVFNMYSLNIESHFDLFKYCLWNYDDSLDFKAIYIFYENRCSYGLQKTKHVSNFISANKVLHAYTEYNHNKLYFDRVKEDACQKYLTSSKYFKLF